MPAGKRRFDLENWLTVGLPGWFQSQLLQVTKEIAGQWGRLTISAKRRGMMLSTTDGLLAATVLEHGMTLVTRNVKDLVGLGVRSSIPGIGNTKPPLATLRRAAYFAPLGLPPSNPVTVSISVDSSLRTLATMGICSSACFQFSCSKASRTVGRVFTPYPV
jgi:hypothetical protein